MFSFIHLAIPPAPVLFAQLLIGLINGSFYALLSLGLAIIFGLLNIINFTHGAQYMVGALGIAIERLLLRHIARLDHLYGLLLTFGLALIIEGVFRQRFGSSGLPYTIPAELQGGRNLGFMFLPIYRGWVIVFSLAVCLATWFVVERT